MAYTAWSVVFGEQPSAAKWNQLGSNDAHFYSFLGDNLAWQSWTPTWTNLTVGDATQASKYTRVGNTVIYRVSLIFGSTTSMGTGPYFTLPVTSVSPSGTANVPNIGTLRQYESGGTTYSGLVGWRSTTTGLLLTFAVSGSNVIESTITSSVPFSWGNLDEIYAQGFYEAA